ncbi:hypothetical protein HID58_048403 [Brassica napus]|uniref:Uncharacterized protein n=1 Tax=Brassica napus TaxID=3708 RepID=A0ABQ8B204_BRANA|nr:hypothetical protein HID58_048403 [Brassica napus]
MEVFHFPEEGGDPGTGPGKLHSGEPVFLLAGIQRPVSCLGFPLIDRFRHQTRGINCALKSTRVAHSQQASLRQDIPPVIPRSRLMGSRLLREFSQRLPLYMLCLSSFPSNFLLFPRRRLQLSSSEAGEGSDYDLMVPLPISCVYAAPPLVGPASLVGEDDLAEWRSSSHPRRARFQLHPGEIAVYEAFFDSGLRGTILALIADFTLATESPCLENPHSYPKLRSCSRITWLALTEERGNSIFPLAADCLLWRSFQRVTRKDRICFYGVLRVLSSMEFYSLNSSCSFKRRESCSPGAAASGGSTSGDMSGGVTNDPFAAYQEAVKVMSAKKGSGSRSASGDEVMITGSRRSPVVKLEPSPSLSGKRPKSGGVTTRSAQQSADIARSAGSLATALSNLHLNDGSVLPIGDSSEVIQVLQGGLLRTVSQLHHLGERLSDEGMLVLREEVEVLKRQVSGEKEQCVAREFEIRDLKEKVKDLEKVAEAPSADALTVNQKNKELEEDIEVLKAAAETFKFEMVMAVNGARVVARWELMREWLRKQSAQWDLVTALEQYKTVVQEEARSKGAPLPTFEDEPAIPPSSDMDMDSSVKPRGSPT